ncbi:interferon-induced very large GTPase 1-like, partial [Pseudoliparis swirei]|uniref:interferon-induced very large GTPase 1-like n=1 Tax=Pseudoliparis swirei TaxID=2059687 RepID=UPI0024BDCC7E
RKNYSIFKTCCKGSSSAVVLGELICDKLKSSTVKAVCNRTSNDLANVMKSNFPAFNGNRSKFEKHMLKSLADKEDFNNFITYIQNPKEQAKSYIREAVQEYIFKDKKEKVLEKFKENVKRVKQEVSGALITATEKEKNRGKEGGLNMWVKEFVSLLKDELTFNTACCQSFSDIKDFDFLKQEIEKGHVSIIEELNSLSLDEIKKFQLKPEQMHIDQLESYCWVKCPFCSAVCTNTVTNHDEDHSVPFHRSVAVNGMHVINSVEISIEFCTTNVASDRSFHPTGDEKVLIPYKKYRTAGPRFATWDITSDKSALEYWKWFVSRFEKQLEDHYTLKFQSDGQIPSQWKRYSKDQAIKSLDNL